MPQRNSIGKVNKIYRENKTYLNLKPYLRLLLSILCLCAAPAFANTTPQIDTKSIDALWHIADLLKKNSTPTEADWSALFHSAGYASLIANELPQAKLQQLIIKAFSQDHASEEHDSSKTMAAVIEHFRYAEKNRIQIAATLNEFSAEMAKSYPILMNMTRTYLPTAAESIKTPNNFAVAVFSPDARGYADGIVIDPLFIAQYKSSIGHFIAHELHHFYANSLKKPLGNAVSDDDSNLRWVLWQLHSEGIADMIDKTVIYFENGYMADTPYAKFFRKSYAQSTAIIQSLDAGLRQYAATSDKAKLAAEIKNNIPMAGHPTGYFIAKTIEHQLGREALVQTLGAPHLFFSHYNRAAAKDGNLPLFSAEALATIKDLHNLETNSY